MNNSDTSSRRLVRILEFHRWLIPGLLASAGIGYIVWENILWDGYSFDAPPVLIGLGLLGVIGPLLAFATLTFAVRGAASWERAEQIRDRQQKHLLALNQIGESVNQTLELNQVLDHALDRVLEVMRLASGEVRLRENAHLELRAARGVSDSFLDAERVIPLGQCNCGKSAEGGELIAIEDVDRVPAFAGTPCACEHFRSTVSVPVRTAERVIGVIHLAAHEPRQFDQDDRGLLTAIGYLVGTAVEKAQLHAQLGSLNQELEARVGERTHELNQAKEELAEKAETLARVLAEERRVEEKTRARIAHDLHDGVQQLIVGALYEIQAARESVAKPGEGFAARLASAQDLLRRIETEMRAAIYSLRPLALDAQGLAPALRECVARFERISGVDCDLKIEGTPRRFEPELEVAAFRIVQEALNNVEAHARARKVRVHLGFNPRALTIEIADDGVGFDVAALKNRAGAQLGLLGMRERAASVGGALEIESRGGAGTRVCLRAPVKSERVR